MATSVSPATSHETKPGTSPDEQPYPSPFVRWYMVTVLLIVYVFSFADRQIMNLMVGDIKGALKIESDQVVGILMGPAFAVSYCIFGFPLGRMADRVSRRGLIAIGLTCWSLMAAGCGFARTFWQMFTFRVGVGFGEATLSPAAYSLITDSFPKHRLATAIGVYGTGIYIGSGLSSMVGGAAIAWLKKTPDWTFPIVGTIDPWRKVFILVGLAGILAVPLMYTFMEPIRRGLGGKKQATVAEVMRFFRLNKITLICHTVGFALLSFSSYGSSAWIPTLFIRRHEWTQAKIGLWYGAIVMIFGTLGVATGGYIADFLSKRGFRDAKMRVGLLASVIWFPFGMAYPLMSDPRWSFAILIPAVYFTSMPFGVAPAAIVEMTPAVIRGQASALYLFVVTLIGLAFGPYIVSWFSDTVFGRQNVHLSLFWVATGAHVISTFLLWYGLKYFRKSLDRLEQMTAKPA